MKAGIGTLAVPVMYLRVADVADVDGQLPSRASWLEACSQADESISGLCFDGVVERREEHAALPRDIATQADRPALPGCELVDGRAAARPFGSVVEPIACRVARRAAGHQREIAVVGRVEPRDVACQVHAVTCRRIHLDLDAPDRRRSGVADVGHTGLEERLHLQVTVVGVEHRHVRADTTGGHRVFHATLVAPRELRVEARRLRRSRSRVEPATLEAPRGRQVGKRAW